MDQKKQKSGRASRAVKLTLLALAAIGLLGIVAACGDDAADIQVADPTPTAVESVDKVSDIAGTGATPTPASSVELPEYGGVVSYVSCCSGRVNVASDPSSNLGGMSGYVLYNGLIQQHFPFDPAKGLVIEPSLAETWELSEDGTEWIFHLRRGVTFHDGTTFDADDVVATVNRILDPETLIDSRQVPMRNIFPGGIKKIDDFTVSFNMGDATNEAGLVYIQSDELMIVPSHLIIGPDPDSENVDERWTFIGLGDDESGTLSMGTGAFYQTQHIQEELMEMKRYEGYWKKDARGNSLPYLDGWKQTQVTDGTRRLARFVAGTETFTIGTGAGMHPDEAQDLCDAGQDETCFTLRFPHGYFAQVLNPATTPQFEDDRIVKAARYANDMQVIFDLSYGGRLGFTWMDTQRFPDAGLSTEEKKTVIPWSDPAQRAAYVQTAKDLVAEAGYPDGFDLPSPIYSSGLCGGSFLDQYSRQVDALVEVGIRGELECREGIVANDELRAGRFSIEGPGDSIFLLFAGYSLVLDALLDSPMVGNATYRWGAPQVTVDAMYRDTVRTADDAERNAKYQDIERFLANDTFTVFPSGFSSVTLSAHGCLKNYSPGGTWNSHSWSFERAWLTEECH